MGFTNAPNVFDDVQYEVTYGQKNFATAPMVRVDAVFEPTTGQNLGDDFKRFIFPSGTAMSYVGQMFIWKNNYWLGINSDNYQSLGNSLICRRCNNTLRWKDEYENTIIEPCIIANKLLEAADYTTSQMVTIAGYIKVYCQRNIRTNTVKETRRVLFGVQGNWTAYKVFGNGKGNFTNSETLSNTSASITELQLGASYVNADTDDLVNGVADAYRTEFTLSILEGNISQIVGFEKQLTATVKRDGVVVSENVTWTTTNKTVVSCDSSGNIDCLKIGTATIRCTMTNNSSVSDQITILVADSPMNNYKVVISPNIEKIYEGDSQGYSCYLENNGVVTSNEFVFSASGAPANSYRLYITDGNNFIVQNIAKYLTSPLIVSCVSGAYSKDISIDLRGDF